MTDKTPSRPLRIIAWLETQDGPRIAAEVADGIGESRYSTTLALCDMRRAGRVVTEGPRGSRRYALPTGPVIFTPEEELKRQKRKQAKRDWGRTRKGAIPMEELKARRAVEREKRRAKEKAEREAARIVRDAERAANRAATAARREAERAAARAAAPLKKAPKPVKAARSRRAPIPVGPVPGTLTADKPEARPTSFDFERAGGKVERLKAAWEQ